MFSVLRWIASFCNPFADLSRTGLALGLRLPVARHAFENLLALRQDRLRDIRDQVAVLLQCGAEPVEQVPIVVADLGGRQQVISMWVVAGSGLRTRDGM